MRIGLETDAQEKKSDAQGIGFPGKHYPLSLIFSFVIPYLLEFLTRYLCVKSSQKRGESEFDYV